MPDYPTTPKTFTTRSAGQTIAASHVNDLQDEVNAIEAGLLDGTARVNSSNSTLANLSVTGGSTLSSLTLTGNMTSTGILGGSGARIREVWVGQLEASTLTVTAGQLTAATFQSSNSTVNALQVSSNSTIGGNLRVNNSFQSSASTVTGTLQVDGNCTFVGNLRIVGNSTFEAGITSSNLQVANSTMGRLTLSSAAPAAPSVTSLYSNTLVKAWAAISSAAGITNNVNISSASVSTTGDYRLAFATAIGSSAYAAIATPYSATPVGLDAAISDLASTGFMVTISDGAARINVSFSVAVFG